MRYLYHAVIVLSLLSTAVAQAGPPTEASYDIAITLDDLPWVGGLRPHDTRLGANTRILAALQAHAALATGFVVCNRMRKDDPVIFAWNDAGMFLGNHSNSHPHIDALSPADWEKDIETCVDRLRTQAGVEPAWFRFPYLQSGKTIARRDAAVATLAGMKLRGAPVSVDTGEYALVAPYVKALAAGDTRTADAIGAAWVTHVVDAVQHYKKISKERLGRQVRHVLLLHANALAADHLDALLTRLEADGARFVSLDHALADPAYAREDDYAGGIGLSWLYRFAPQMTDAWAWDNAQVKALQEQFGE